MIEILFEIVFSFLAELVLPLIGEALVELGFHSTAETLTGNAKSRLLVGSSYTLFGAVLGFLSLFIYPKMVFENRVWPILFFILSPIAAGFALSIVSFLLNRGIRAVNWFETDKFVFGVLFAVGYSVSRVFFG